VEDLSACDLAVEAVFEDMTVKLDVLAALDRMLPASAILASNTSYLDLDRLAGATGRPDTVVGLHFFSPANVMRLLEVVQGARTSQETADTAFALAKRLRKIPVPARVGEGFIANRIYNAYRVQCEYLLEEGAFPEEVDAALEQFGFAMGPFATWDLAGLDIAWRMRRRLAEQRDPRARYVDLLDILCESGRFGRKAGRGWYVYPSDAKKGIPDDAVRRLIEDASRRKNVTRRRLPDQEIVARALAAILNEAALVLAEGIARCPADIDLVLVHGYGFPASRGGPLFWAGRQPQAEIAAALAEVERATGFGFRRGPVAQVLDRIRAEANGSTPPAPQPPRPDFRE
jgi:3-hydroxyacyl-CoA dehydrogenase